MKAYIVVSVAASAAGGIVTNELLKAGGFDLGTRFAACLLVGALLGKVFYS